LIALNVKAAVQIEHAVLSKECFLMSDLIYDRQKKEGHGVSWTDGQMHHEHFMTDTKGQGMVSLYSVIAIFD